MYYYFESVQFVSDNKQLKAQCFESQPPTYCMVVLQALLLLQLQKL